MPQNAFSVVTQVESGLGRHDLARDRCDLVALGVDHGVALPAQHARQSGLIQLIAVEGGSEVVGFRIGSGGQAAPSQ